MKNLWSEFGHLHWLQNANALNLECPFFQPFYRQGRHKIWKFWFLALCVAYPVLMWLAWFRRGRPAGIACLQIWIDFYACTDTDKKIAFKTRFFFRNQTGLNIVVFSMCYLTIENMYICSFTGLIKIVQKIRTCQALFAWIKKWQ